MTRQLGCGMQLVAPNRTPLKATRHLFTLFAHITSRTKENIQFIFSTAVDGKIKAWLYDNLGSRADYNAPGNWCTTMAYSADGSRLFSCGTSKEGETFVVEWNESEGAVKRTYQGFRKCSSEVVQFDTTRNRFLVAGDEFMIKFWDMNNANLLTTFDADGGLPASPRMRFNKEGTLLAVATHDNGIKILANGDGLRLMRTLENHSFDATRVGSETITKPIINPLSAAAATAADIATTSGITDRTAPPMAITGMISKPIYTNSGVAILALASNAILRHWKWPRNEHHLSGKATTGIAPQLWQPPSGILMTNEITDTNPEKLSIALHFQRMILMLCQLQGGRYPFST